MKKINSFEAACAKTGASTKLPYPKPKTPREERANLMYQQEVIAEALNGKWKPKMSDSNQAKYYPWMRLDVAASAFRFYGSFYDVSLAIAGSGVRLKDRATSDYFGKQFEKLISDHLMLLEK